MANIPIDRLILTDTFTSSPLLDNTERMIKVL